MCLPSPVPIFVPHTSFSPSPSAGRLAEPKLLRRAFGRGRRPQSLQDRVAGEGKTHPTIGFTPHTHGITPARPITRPIRPTSSIS